MTTKRFLVATLLLSLTTGIAILLSCNNNSNIKEPTDTTTSGEVWISADESLKPLVDSEVAAFMHTYSGTKIHVRYKSGEDAVGDILDDSSRVVVATRQLRTDEQEVYKKRGFTPELVHVAVDAVALIINNSNSDTNLTTKQVTDILSGKITKWSQINANSKLGDISLIFDNKSSGVARYIIDSVNSGNPLPANSFALNNTLADIEYVSNNKNSLGFIGYNWLSDKADTTIIGFLKKIHIINMQPVDSNDFYPPNQYYIAYHGYPYYRDIYVIDPEARMGLGTGFANFFWGDVGQTIILRSGLVPAHASLKFTIQLKNSYN